MAVFLRWYVLMIVSKVLDSERNEIFQSNIYFHPSFGVCCLIRTPTDSQSVTVSGNNTYIQSPNFPRALARETDSSGEGTYTYTVEKIQNGTEFIQMTIQSHAIVYIFYYIQT